VVSLRVVCVLVLPSFALGWSIGHDALRTTSSSYVEKQVRCVVYTRFTSPSKKVLCQIFQSLGARTVISFLVCDGASQHQLELGTSSAASRDWDPRPLPPR
jgi:hypothetical protein